MEFSKNKWLNIAIFFTVIVAASIVASLLVTQKEVKDASGNVIGTKGTFSLKKMKA